jgi:uncharacterized protein (DUF2267 family)
MDELVKLVASKTGLPEDKARVAVKTVVDYLKERLPAPLASQVDNVLNSGAAAKGLDDLSKGLGSLLGGKK